MTYAVGDVVRIADGAEIPSLSSAVGELGCIVAVIGPEAGGSASVLWPYEVSMVRRVQVYALKAREITPAGPLTDEEEATLMRWRLSQ